MGTDVVGGIPWIEYTKENEQEHVDQMCELAEKYNVTDSAIAVAWILRHPAGIQTIIGTTNKERIAQISKASNVHLTREEWYRLYMAAGNRLPETYYIQSCTRLQRELISYDQLPSANN